MLTRRIYADRALDVRGFRFRLEVVTEQHGGGTEEQNCAIAEYVVSVFNEMAK